MERKTKQRILGILVVIGLIIVMLPLFQSGKELPAEATVVKAPPFPDQSVQVATNDTEQEAQQPTIESAPHVIAKPEPQQPLAAATANPTADVNAQPAASAVAQPAVVEPVSSAAQVASTASATPSSVPAAPTAPSSAIPVPSTASSQSTSPLSPANAVSTNADVKNTTAASATNATNAMTTAMQNADTSLAANDDEDEAPAAQTPVPVKTIPKKVKHVKLSAKKPVIKTTKHVYASYKPKAFSSMQAPLNDNGLANLKNPAWVIQIGSFKNKANALRLVNQLRANGYHAFIQQVSTSSIGSSTRVFVGPEPKLTSARALASQLENTMRIHAIVISYKPLVL